MPPLTGQSILVTRPGIAGAELAVMLEGLGAKVEHVAAIEVVQLPLPADIMDLTKEIDFLILSSAHGIGSASKLLSSLGKFSVFTVGEKTAEAAREQGWEVEAGHEGDGIDGLVDHLLTLEIRGKSFLWPRSNLAQDEALARLQEAGALIKSFPAYETKNPLQECPVDLSKQTAIVFASPSAVAHLEQVTAKNVIEDAKKTLRALAIGKTTAHALRERRWSKIDVAAKPSNEGLLALALEYLTSKPHG